jgi:hypothetical protein
MDIQQLENPLKVGFSENIDIHLSELIFLLNQDFNRFLFPNKLVIHTLHNT